MSPSPIDRIVIVGTGQAACQALATLRESGFSGSLSVVGEEPLPPYQRPPLSKGYLQGKLEVDRLLLRGATYYKQHDVDLMLGVPACSIDRNARAVMLADGRRLSYDKLLLATGAS